MSRILLVAEATPLSVGEFRRRWVRALYRLYLWRYRRALAAVASRLTGAHEVTVIARREALDLVPSAAVRLVYDEEILKNDSAALEQRTRRLVDDWFPPRNEPGLTFDDVWLPDLMPVTKGIVLRLEIVEYVGALERALDDVKPDEVLLLTGASLAERVASALALERKIPVRIARRLPAPAALAAAALARKVGGLRAREERRAMRAHLSHPRGPLAPAGDAPFLFSVSHARHFMVVAPLLRALAAHGRRSVVLVATSENRAMRAPLRGVTADGAVGGYLMDYLPREEAERLVRELQPVSARLVARLANRPGGPLAEVVAPYARDAVTTSLATARLYLAAAGRALDAHRPAAVVITSDRRMSERAFALAARRRGTPTLLFYGGALLGRDRTNPFDVGDRILLLGEHARAGLIETGLDPRRLTAIGDPRSNDARLVPRERLRADVCAHLGLAPQRPLVVMVSKYVSLLFSADEKAAFYRTVRDAARLVDGVQIVVKVHPNENLAVLRDDIARWGWPDAVLTQGYDIHRLFGAADAAVMVTSMAGIEAMAMGCPVIAVQGKDFEGGGMPPYVSAGAVERVALGDAAALSAALRRLVTDAAARAALVDRGRRFAAPYLHPVDGALGDRLLAVVDEIRAERRA